MIQKKLFLFTGIGVLTFSFLTAQPQLSFDRYHKPEELSHAMQQFVDENPSISTLHKIAVSPSKRVVNLIEIGPEISKQKKTLPAVLVVANLEGAVPIASEAALFLIESILDKPETRKDKTWYILPCGNPDAAFKYFDKPLFIDSRNSQPHNDDMDDQVDEDGVEDLDGNGIITMMRVKDPQGEWMPVPGEPRLMKKADNSKGEKGIYKLFTEGIDNDKDGEYNEDGPGGVNIGINFPHLFKPFTKTGGPWAGSEEESHNLIKFISQHREIAISFCFGATNFCLVPPRGGRKSTVDMEKIKISKEYGEMFGADTERTYTMKEIMEMAKPFAPPGMELTEAMVAQFLQLGAEVNPLPEDLKIYQELSEKYKEYLKENKLDTKRLDPAAAKDGSFELWTYYHLGLPSFSMDFWSLPKIKEEKKEEESITPEKLEKMSNEEFIALGEEKIGAFLKSVGAPDSFSAEQVVGAIKGGMMTTEKMAEMLRQMPKSKSEEGADPKEKALLAFSDSELGGEGYVDWKAFKHPTLEEVEIGGAVPYASSTPPAKMIQTLLTGQVPWVLKLTEKMARIKIAETEVKSLGNGIYHIKAWVENSGYLPYPTAMGIRNIRILPVIVTLTGNGFDILEGKARSLIKSIGGHQTQMVSWIVHAKKPTKLDLKVTTNIAWGDTKSIDLGGAQ